MIPVLIVEDVKPALEDIVSLIKRSSKSLNIELNETCIEGYKDGLVASQKGIYALAVIDLHLPDPNASATRDRDRFLGLKLLKAVREFNKNTVTCAYTAFAKDTVDSLVGGNPEYLLSKEYSRQERLGIIEKMLKETLIRFNYYVKLELDEAILNAFGKNRSFSGLERQQWEICLRRLLRECESEKSPEERRKSHVRFHPVGKGRSGAGIVAMYPGPQNPVVLKFANIGDLQNELKRYEEFVKPFLTKFASTSNDQLSQAGEKGILSYAFVGPTHVNSTLADAIDSPDYKGIPKGLISHFTENCRRWFSVPDYDIPSKIGPDAQKHFKVNPDAIQDILSNEKATPAIKRAAEHIGSGIDSNLLIGKIFQAIRSDRKNIFCKEEAIIHGDLNVNNLIWDKREFWMIDFAQTGRGHGLFDFVKLEASLKFDITTSFNMSMADEEKVSRTLAFEEVLLQRLKQSVPKAGVYNQLGDGLQRKLNIICAIRGCAVGQCATPPGLEYNLVLFFVTAKHVEYLTRDIKNEASKYVPLVHALVSAYKLALLVESTVES